MTGWGFTGVIEGFYGPPWSWDAREEVLAVGHRLGLSHYVYAPKDDPLHRDRWREPHPEADLDGFRRLAGTGTLRVGYAISPGLSIAYDAEADRTALAAKVDQVVDAGIGLVCLALDDIPVRPGLGDDHARLTRWLAEHLGDRAELLLVPTEYTGALASPYLDALAAGVPDHVPMAWTGPAVVNDRITADDARRRAAVLGGRRPWLWENYPVNDAIMGDRLFLGPLRSRDPDLAEVCSGYLANPMERARASLPALASIAAFVRGEDPASGWGAFVDERGWRTLAEACDGEEPRRLVAAAQAHGPDDPDWGDDLGALHRWLRAADPPPAIGLEDEAGPWIAQTAAEARVGRLATRLLQLIRPVVTVDAGGHGIVAAPGLSAALEQAMALAASWPAVRRSPTTVLGPRCSFRPAIDQWPDGEWRYRAAALEEDRNALDHLVRHALAALDAVQPGSDPVVEVDGEATALEPVDAAGGAPRWAFRAQGGERVTVRCGGATAIDGPGGPPLADHRLPGYRPD